MIKVIIWDKILKLVIIVDFYFRIKITGDLGGHSFTISKMIVGLMVHCCLNQEHITAVVPFNLMMDQRNA